MISYGFDIDPALAGALWEIADPSYLAEESPGGVPRIDEENWFGPRLAEEIAALTCPEGYGLKEATSDLFRVQKLAKKTGTRGRKRRRASSCRMCWSDFGPTTRARRQAVGRAWRNFGKTVPPALPKTKANSTA